MDISGQSIHFVCFVFDLIGSLSLCVIFKWSCLDLQLGRQGRMGWGKVTAVGLRINKRGMVFGDVK
jgi:hypothetical protein